MGRVVLVCAVLAVALCGCGKSERERTSAGANKPTNAAEERAKAGRRREKIYVSARKLSLAMTLASAVANDVLPGPAEWKKKLLPFVKKEDRSAMDEATWVFPGGSLMALPNPSATEILRVERGGDAAIVFADGHTVLKVSS